MAHTRNSLLNTLFGNAHDIDLFGREDALKLALQQHAALNTKPPLPRKLTMSDLQSEAGALTLEQLSHFWRARWGDSWVTDNEIAEADNFYLIVHSRLVAADMLEHHQTSPAFVNVYRIK